ncbi:hypothetical protein BDW22DRAFT_464410 [Trametopsis cervina]|nr:hypothetical protein BDW22DRAFT_464410 [Trametopsis cervina]
MNILAIINQPDLDRQMAGASVITSSVGRDAVVLPDNHGARRSARTVPLPPSESSDTPSSGLSWSTPIVKPNFRAANGNGVTKRKVPRNTHSTSASSWNALVTTTLIKPTTVRRKAALVNDANKLKHRRGNSKTTRRKPQARISPAQELVLKARAAAAHSSGVHGSHRPVSVMDVVLNAQTPNRRLDVEDLRDAIDECHRIALSFPASDEDDVLANMFVPGRVEARQAFLAEDVGAVLDEFSPRGIYQVSAERSTAAWDPSLDSAPDDHSIASTEL